MATKWVKQFVKCLANRDNSEADAKRLLEQSRKLTAVQNNKVIKEMRMELIRIDIRRMCGEVATA